MLVPRWSPSIRDVRQHRHGAGSQVDGEFDCGDHATPEKIEAATAKLHPMNEGRPRDLHGGFGKE